MIVNDSAGGEQYTGIQQQAEKGHLLLDDPFPFDDHQYYCVREL